MEAQIAQEAVEKIEKDPALLYSRVIVVDGEGWHHGVIGIVASRITERFGKPCMVISTDGDMAKGSGRSVEGFSLFQAVCACGDLMERYGGHPMAAGITLKAENVPLFRERINQYAAKTCPEMPAQVLRIDCKLNPAALSPEMPQSLAPLEPYGSGNPQPLFGLYGMELQQIVPVGGGNHLRLLCAKKGVTISCMKFGTKPEDFPFVPGEVLDLAVTLEAKEFRGEPQLTVSVREVKLSGLDMDQCVHTYRLYEKLQRQEPLSPQEGAELLPTRQDLAALYRKLVSLKGDGFSAQSLAAALPGFGLGKLLLCLDMLQERRLVALLGGEERKSAEILPTQGKVDIFASPVFQRAEALIDIRIEKEGSAMALVVQISTYEELKKIIAESGKEYDREQIEAAYRLAEEKHREQKRSSGEPYIIHPLSVAAILVGLGMDSQSVMAGLLHDVVEDTDCTLEDIQKQFGKEVALLIDGVTKLGKIPIPPGRSSRRKTCGKCSWPWPRTSASSSSSLPIGCTTFPHWSTCPPKAAGQGRGVLGGLRAHRPPPWYPHRQGVHGGRFLKVPGPPGLSGD